MFSIVHSHTHVARFDLDVYIDLDVYNKKKQKKMRMFSSIMSIVFIAYRRQYPTDPPTDVHTRLSTPNCVPVVAAIAHRLEDG